MAPPRPADADTSAEHRSEVLPDLDLAPLATFVHPGENQTRLAKQYQAALR